MTNIIATPGVEKASVAFTTNNAGKTPTSYTVISIPDNKTVISTTGSPIIVEGLTADRAYTFKVIVDYEGGALASAISTEAVTILAPPSANPTATISTVEPGDGQVKVTFDVVPDGKTPNKYTATSTPEGKTASNTDGSPIIVEGLTNGTEYTFKVTVSFDDNDDVTSAASVAVTPTASETPTATITKVEAGDAQVTVTFDVVPAGKTATKYTVTSVEDATKTAFNEDGSPIIVTGLTNGTAYTFTVTVTFDDDDEVTSAASEAVTPEDATGINDVEEVATAKLYPNPVRDVVTISGLQGNETIRFYDASGRAVLEHKADASEANITVSQLPKGIYIVRIGTKALKLMKI
ncbi:hypothetical protein AGMMS49965_14980 [Bacteroidia bacterium]|nr:hypothetical protein AGMMS49965_14980 [Bacteroidia bacterium]